MDRAIEGERGNRTSMQTQSTICTRSRASPPFWIDVFFFAATVLLTWEQRCACQEMQSCRVHVTSFDRLRDAGSRVTERARRNRDDDRFQSSQMTALFCARRLTARQAFVPAYCTHIVVFAGYFAHVCRYLPSNFITLAAGAGDFFKQLGVGCYVCESQSPRKVERLVLLHSAYDERRPNHHRRNLAPRHGVILRVSTALRLRDHFYAQD